MISDKLKWNSDKLMTQEKWSTFIKSINRGSMLIHNIGLMMLVTEVVTKSNKNEFIVCGYVVDSYKSYKFETWRATNHKNSWIKSCVIVSA